MEPANVPQAARASLRAVTSAPPASSQLGLSLTDIPASSLPSPESTDCPISMADPTLYKNVAGGGELCHFHFSAEKHSSLCVPGTKLGLLNFFSPELSKMNSKMSKDGAAVLTITCRVRFRTHEYTAHLFPS